MTDNNVLGAASRYGSESQKQVENDQRRANSSESGKSNRSTIVVLTTLNAHDKYSYLTVDEQLRDQQIAGKKVLDRLPALIEHAAGASVDPNSAYYILHPNNGVPTRIDERIPVGEANAVVISYTVNKAVSEMHGVLSLALFSAAGATDLTDLAAEFGIHAIAIVDEAKAAEFISALAKQVELLNIVNVSSLDDADGALDAAVIDYSVLPGNPIHVVSGAVRTFIMQSASGEVFAAIPNNGEMNVKDVKQVAAPVDLEEDFDQNEEVEDQQEGEDEAPAGTDFFGYKAENLTVEQMTEALVAIDYDCSAMDEDGIRESFETEQNIWLEGEGATSDVDGDEQEEDGEEEDEDEAFDAVQYLASVLAQENFDRRALVALVKTQELKALKSDSDEQLVQKLLDLVQDATEQEIIELLQSFQSVLTERSIECPTIDSVLSDDSDEESEEEEEDGDEEDDQEEDEAESDEDEDEAETSELTAADVTDPLDYFQFDGGSLNHEQRMQAVQALGENTDGLNIIQVMKAFNRIQAQTAEIDVEAQTDDADVQDQIREILEAQDEASVELLADAIGAVAEEGETFVDAILESGSEEHYENLAELLGQFGVELDDVGAMSYDEVLLALLPAYFADEDEQEGDEEEADFDDEQDEEEDTEQEEAIAISTNVDNADSLKFLSSVEASSAGPMVSVEMSQSLIINFTLTDGNTYRDLEKELGDVNGINYRIPFNIGSAGKPQGSMHVPAQTLVDIMTRAGTSRFLADPQAFNVGSWAESLEQTLSEEIANTIYQGRIEDGEDPTEAGLIVGDFIDDEEMADVEEMGYDPSQFDEMQGDHLPISSLYNAHTRVRPVQVENSYVALNTTVLNVALPGFWGVSTSDITKMVQAAVNRVIGLSDDQEELKVYAAFTIESSALLNNDDLYSVIGVLREMEGVQSYSASDAAAFADAEDVIEVASSLDNRNLPFAILSSGLASATFENGGDLTVLVPCFEDEADDEDESESDDE